MEKLKAEMERKKALAEAMRQKVTATENSTNDATTTSAVPVEETKFLRQRDREYLKVKELEEAQQQLDQQREERRRLQQQRDEEARVAAARLNNPNKSHLHSSNKAAATSVPLTPSTQHPNLRLKYDYVLQLPLVDIKQRLRRWQEPVTQFGESELDRKERLINLLINKDLQGWTDDAVVTQQEGNTASSNTNSNGKRSHDPEEFTTDAPTVKKARGTDDSINHGNRSSNEDAQNAHSDSDNDSDNDSDHEREQQRATSQEAKRQERQQQKSAVPANGLYFDPAIQYHKMAHLSPEKIIYKFFRSLVKQWEADLHNRPDYEKNTGHGREETKAQKKCKDYIRPLFKLCQRREVPHDILHRLVLMVQHCEEGNFVKANDEYMRTAIGNAAWPMGLTMVGIHERSGREKISTAKIAHIMNNESERKFLTSVKRLMTFAQTKRPDIPPSMKVN